MIIFAHWSFELWFYMYLVFRVRPRARRGLKGGGGRGGIFNENAVCVLDETVVAGRHTIVDDRNARNVRTLTVLFP